MSDALISAWRWLSTGESWVGDAGIAVRMGEHLWYTGLAVFIAACIGIAAGAVVGHTGKGQAWVLGLSGSARAMPSLGLLTFLALVVPSGVAHAIIPATIVLVVLAVPPILAATASGFHSIDRSVISAAYAIGFSTPQVVFRVEFPLAMPIILGGLRSAWLQVLATATIAAYLGLGGLGSFVLDALAVRDVGVMLGASILVAVVALLTDAVFALLEKLVLQAGVRRSSSGEKPRTVAGAHAGARDEHAGEAGSMATGATDNASCLAATGSARGNAPSLPSDARKNHTGGGRQHG